MILNRLKTRFQGVEGMLLNLLNFPIAILSLVLTNSQIANYCMYLIHNLRYISMKRIAILSAEGAFFIRTVHDKKLFTYIFSHCLI